LLAVVVCGITQSCSPEDGHIDARNILRYKFDNKHQIGCILFVSLSLPYFHHARSQEPKKKSAQFFKWVIENNSPKPILQKEGIYK